MKNRAMASGAEKVSEKLENLNAELGVRKQNFQRNLAAMQGQRELEFQLSGETPGIGVTANYSERLENLTKKIQQFSVEHRQKIQNFEGRGGGSGLERELIKSNFDDITDDKRIIPGKTGVVTGGSSTKLGKNLLEDMGVNRSEKWSGYQAQHVIPAEMSKHPVIKKMGMDLDDASNGIFLREPDDQISPMSRHRGYHSTYSDFVKSKLDNIDLDLSPEKLQNEVLNLQNKLKTIQSKGLPLYPNQGATQELWKRFYDKLN